MTDITPIAVTNWRSKHAHFGIKDADRQGHIYVIGKTGTGKSSLLGRMIVSDLERGNGVAFIDPHGDLAEMLLHHVPLGRIHDVVYLNAGDLDYPVPFNPLEHVDQTQHHLVVSELISIFKKIWAEFWGPRLEHILRYSLFTLLEYPRSTLLDLPPLLTDKAFRHDVLRYVSQEPVRSFWVNEFEKYSPWLKAEATAPILNKVGQFLTSLPLRNIVGQPRNSFSVRSLMDEGKILIVNLSKGSIGEDTASLLGAMVVTDIYLAALSRTQLGEDRRRPFYLYVDEFHAFLTLSFADILSEARKYGLHLTLAHQYMSQLKDEVRAAIFGNVGTIISFRVGSEDAELLAREFHPVCEEIDLVTLPNYNIYLKLMVDGVTSSPFSAATLPVPKPEGSCAAVVTEASRKRYGKGRERIEWEIQSRLRRSP
jgi:hypothetical protein